MVVLSYDEKLILMQHAISKYDSESILKDKLKEIISPKEVERLVDTLIATQRVRRIGQETLQNNVSHIGELPETPGNIADILSTI